jgi:hypothetical protein
MQLVFKIIICCFIAQSAFGQVNAVARFDSNLVETGELFTLRVSVPKSAGKPQQIDFQSWENDSIHLQSQEGWRPDGNTYTNHFNLLTFDADTLVLPPLQVAWSDGTSANTDSLLLMVIATPSPDDINDIEDIKDIYREPSNWSDYLPWFMIIGGLLLAAILAFWWLRRRPQKTTLVTNRVITLPAHELAFKRLEVLASKKLWQKGEIKQYYAELTYIARSYLENKYHIPALESISEEILIQLNQTDFPLPLRPALADLLEQADLAKFAKGIPPEAYHEQAWAVVKNMVEKTR